MESVLTPAQFDNSLLSMDLKQFELFRELIHRETGIWLRDGKEYMLASRLSRRLRHLGMSSFTEYYNYVEKSADGAREIGELINCVTTNKTSFFRENHHFEFLSTKAVPEIQQAASHGGARSVRIWSAACSTGQEPYSIAISVLEALHGARGAATSGTSLAPPAGWEIKLVASDIDTTVLDTARRGVYGEDALADVSQALHKRYFLRGKGEMAGQVKIKPELTHLIEFKRINLNDRVWPVQGPFDAIFFRNALIYFNQKTQETFLRRMAHLLRPAGYLFLGHSEHIPWLHDVVTPLGHTVYQLRDAAP